MKILTGMACRHVCRALTQALMLAGVALTVSCATSKQPTAQAAINHSAAYPAIAYSSRESIEAIKPQIAQAMGALALNDVHYTTTTALRAQAANSAGPRPTAHEIGFNAVTTAHDDEVKFSNEPRAQSRSIQILTQNSLPANDGGWSEVGDAYVHRYSGMRCPKSFDMVLNNEKGEIVQRVYTALLQIRIYDQSGMDTSCHLTNEAGSVLVTLFASHWPDRSLEDHFAEGIRLIVDHFPMALKSEVPVMVATPNGDSYSLSVDKGVAMAAAYISEPLNGQTYKTALWLNKTGGWHVKVRATFPVEMKDEKPQLSIVEMVSATLHASTVVAVDKHVNQAQTVSYTN
jgi:hypothetical protein